MSYVLTINGQDYQLAGTHGPMVIGGDTGNPKDRIQASVTWNVSKLQVAAMYNWVSGYSLTDPSGGVYTCAQGGAYNGWFPANNIPGTYCQVNAFGEMDLSAKYELMSNWVLTASITNLFNNQPPVDFNTYGAGALPYNPAMAQAGAVGRMVSAGMTYRF